jgi:hypothetical protein
MLGYFSLPKFFFIIASILLGIALIYYWKKPEYLHPDHKGLTLATQQNLNPMDMTSEKVSDTSLLPLKADSRPSEKKITSTAPANFSKSIPLLYEENFDTEDFYQRVVKIQNSTPYGFQIVDTLSFIGKRSARFELRMGDPLTANGTRSEVIISPRATESERWYSFAIYLPAEEFAFDLSNEVISQWHQGGSPALSLRIQKNEFYLRLPATATQKKWKNISLGKVEKDQWTEFVFHINHSGNSEGWVKVWKNGKKITEYQGPNNNDQLPLPVWKIGVYKAIWNGKQTPTSQRVAFFDAIKIGNASHQWDQMSSWSSRSSLRSTQQQQ